ncbi:MAG TPA: hypothetical protein VMC62_11685 [Longilinea sp.]|nr:hypothetical protein [Longilinea sp.]
MESSGRFELKSFQKKTWITLALACMAFPAGFLIASVLVYKIGFPLDDAWIHQTFARNLALYGEWAFVHGQPSAGSTSPLWSALISIGYFLHIDTYAWTFALGWLGLFGTAAAGEILFRVHYPEAKFWFPWVGLMLAAEWHLVWSADSGMETGVMAAVVVLTFLLLSYKNVHWFVLGCILGLSVWLRPDGLTLLGPVMMVAALAESSELRTKIYSALKVIAGFLLFFLPYLYFNYHFAGNWWPNTFYAKQAEYQILTTQPFISRLASLSALPIIGVGSLLLPAAVYMVFYAVKNRNWPVIAFFLWWAGYTIIYAWRLPVTYQHGRYLMPAMPVVFLLGALGYFQLFKSRPKIKLFNYVFLVWMASCVGLNGSFYVIGANQYAQDVAVIETEMVDTAVWVRDNTPPDALIAVHDIGAMGYFGDRKILDMAGLVSPEVIPFIRDEAKLQSYLEVQKADYLVVFPSWYPTLIQSWKPVYVSAGRFSPEQGGENMVVYVPK